MNAIDTHMHFNDECSTKHYRDKKIDEYLKSVYNRDIEFFIPSINPKATFFTCSEDCSNDCVELEKTAEKVCPINCKSRNRHRVKIVDGLDGTLIAYCTKCKKIVYEGADPFREYNIKLIEWCKEMNFALPNLVLTLSRSTINYEVKYYEENFGNLFLGYKVHQTTNMRGVNEVGIDSRRPILVHCDSHSYDSIDNAVAFAKGYSGNVILAHSYLLCSREKIEGLSNLYFDVCPTDNFKKNRDSIGHNPSYDMHDNVYEAALDYLDENRILFGTDWPYGSVADNLGEIRNSKIDENIKKKIMSINAKRVYYI